MRTVALVLAGLLLCAACGCGTVANLRGENLALIGGGVGGAAALGAEARHQEKHIRQQLAHRRPGADRGGDVLVERFAVAEQILKETGAAVAGADEDEDATAVLAGAAQEGFDGVAAEVGVDGQGVGVPDGQRRAAVADAGEGGVGVGDGGVGDVVALAVEDGEHTAFTSAAQDALQRGQSGWTTRLEEGELQLDHRHDHFQDAQR